MLEGLSAILDVITSFLSHIASFFSFVSEMAVSVTGFVTMLPLWLSAPLLAIVSISVFKLFAGR